MRLPWSWRFIFSTIYFVCLAENDIKFPVTAALCIAKWFDHMKILLIPLRSTPLDALTRNLFAGNISACDISRRQMSQTEPNGIILYLPLICWVLLLPPTVRILRRLGLSGWWCLIVWIPLVNLIPLWMFAYAR